MPRRVAVRAETVSADPSPQIKAALLAEAKRRIGAAAAAAKPH
ncbi:MAG TPA: hypothetical protein VMS31_01710 [Pyrinomonadaceae bacterium]|nr:hypothetical protein [Pyrinomonadaceae bacterium]